MKNVLILIISLLISSFVSLSDAREIPYTDEGRDRLIRLETKMEEGFKRLEEKIDGGFKAINQRIDDTNRRIDDTNRRIDDLRDLVYGILGGMIVLVGFVIWDRRTALAPAIRRTRDLEEREERIERVLKELARVDPKVAEVLKNVGLL